MQKRQLLYHLKPPTLSAFEMVKGVNAANGGLSISLLSNGTVVNIDNLGISATQYAIPTMSIGTWYHVAVVRNSSNQETVFVNGTRSSTGIVSDTNNYKVSSFIGAWNSGGLGPEAFFQGLISNARVVIGSNVYDPTQTTITVPTAPFTAVTNRQLLLNTTNDSNFLKDGSVNNYTMTNVNGVVASSLNPF